MKSTSGKRLCKVSHQGVPPIDQVKLVFRSRKHRLRNESLELKIMWPACVGELSTLMKLTPKAEVPRFLRIAFNDQGVFNDDKRFVPVRPVVILGDRLLESR